MSTSRQEPATGIERQFGALLEHLRARGIGNLQQYVTHLDLEAVPPEYRDAFSFWRSLSGPSRNLMFDVAQGRRLRKRF